MLLDQRRRGFGDDAVIDTSQVVVWPVSLVDRQERMNKAELMAKWTLLVTRAYVDFARVTSAACSAF